MAEHLLLVDDDAGVSAALREILEDESYLVDVASSAAEAREALQRRGYDLVLLDLWLGKDDGMELLEALQEQDLDLPVIVISGHGNIDAAVKATRLGAYDFLEKPLSLSRVVLTVQNALEKGRLARRLADLTGRFANTDELIGDGPAMSRLKAELRRAAASDGRILLFGENGTGKELAARQVHLLSPRASNPFVEVNCAAIPEELIESELFGHLKGAFTGASADRAGRFEQADGGTLFLDEIADMSLKTQAKVLRVLQEQRFERVGGGASIQVDVRVVAATNKDLRAEIQAGRFREDLFFRLAVIPLEMPPLRERREDVPRLVEHFIAFFAREMGGVPKRVSPAAMEVLTAYAWPGNVRELRNVVERMMIMLRGDEINARDLPEMLRGAAEGSLEELLGDERTSLRAARSAFERTFIERRLAMCGGNVSRAAALLGIERSHLHRKIKAYGIEVVRGRHIIDP